MCTKFIEWVQNILHAYKKNVQTENLGIIVKSDEDLIDLINDLIKY